MSRIFRNGKTYAIVECARSLGYICIGGIEKHITIRRNVDSALKCQEVLKKLTGKGGWKWVCDNDPSPDTDWPDEVNKYKEAVNGCPQTLDD